MKRYKCINEMQIDKCDENGFVVENEYFYVEKGSIWEWDNEFRDDVDMIELYRLSKDNVYSWIEIPKDTLDEYFEEVYEVKEECPCMKEQSYGCGMKCSRCGREL